MMGIDHSYAFPPFHLADMKVSALLASRYWLPVVAGPCPNLTIA
jgi:hypothetical protein